MTTRVFTRAEQGHTHCQVGNLGLAAAVAARWLTAEPTSAAGRGAG